MKSWIMFFTLALTLPLFAAKVSIVEENDMYIPTGVKTGGGITEVEFRSTIDRVYNLYAPYFASLGKSLEIDPKWEDGTVNANTSLWGNTAIINMFGGLARHKVITQDAFALVVCHEIGHHLGGAPKIIRAIDDLSYGTSWATVEGQSDYYGATKCLRRYLAQEDSYSVASRMNLDPVLERACDAVYYNNQDAGICKRVGMAGVSLAALFADLRKLPVAPQVSTPDQTIVTKTNMTYPNPQCRLDTYVQAAFCTESIYSEMSSTDLNKGVCARAKGDTYGARPRCWFKEDYAIPDWSTDRQDDFSPDDLE